MQRTKLSKSTVSARPKSGRVSTERAVAVREWIERRVLPHAHRAVKKLTRELDALKAAEASGQPLTMRAADRIRSLAWGLFESQEATEVIGADASFSPDAEECLARRRRRRASATAGPSRSASVVDPIEAAMSIVKVKANHGVDWSREPLSERERKIRLRLLERTEDPLGLWIIANDAGLTYGRPETWPTDLGSAYLRAKNAEDERRLADKLQDLEEAAREVDEDGAD